MRRARRRRPFRRAPKARFTRRKTYKRSMRRRFGGRRKYGRTRVNKVDGKGKGITRTFYGRYRALIGTGEAQVNRPASLVYPGMIGNEDFQATHMEFPINLQTQIPQEIRQEWQNRYRECKILSYTIYLRQKTSNKYVPRQTLRYKDDGGYVLPDTNQAYGQATAAGINDGRDIAINKILHCLYADPDCTLDDDEGQPETWTIERLKQAGVPCKWAICPKGIKFTFQGNVSQTLSDANAVESAGGTTNAWNDLKPMPYMAIEKSMTMDQNPLFWYCEPCPGARNADQVYFFEPWFKVKVALRGRKRSDISYGTDVTNAMVAANALGNYMPPNVPNGVAADVRPGNVSWFHGVNITDGEGVAPTYNLNSAAVPGG